MANDLVRARRVTSRRPFLPLYVADYWADTKDLSCEQDGIYLNLLMAIWNADGRLPKDDKMLRRICKCDARQWHRSSGLVLTLFVDCGDHYTHKRITKELNRVAVVSEARSEAGTKGGRPKNDPTQPVAHVAKVKHMSVGNPLNSNDMGKPIAFSPRARAREHARALPQTPDMFSESNASENESSSFPQPAELNRDFAVWWARISNKVGKGAARAKYLIARRKASAPTLLDAWVRYERDKPPDRPWVHPATWLHQERWEDEPAPVFAGPRPAPQQRAPRNVGEWAVQQLQAMEDQPDVIEVDYQVRKAQRG